MSPSQILIAEDESIVAMDIQEALKNARYFVSAVANSGREALEKTAETRPDLVLMDIRLKGDMDGVQAATQIRELFDIPVIYLTAYSDDDTVQRAKVSEPFGYLLKPFEKKELNTAIEMALYKHKMERELKEHRRWLAGILASTGDAIIATDAQGLVTFMNPMAERLTGWTSQELCGHLWTEGLRIHEADDGEPSLRKEFLEGRPGALSSHSTLVARDRRCIPVDGSFAPTLDEKGNMKGFVLALRDVSARKRMEEELQHSNQDLERRVRERTAALEESESRFRSISESTPDGVVLTDDQGKIIFCNKSTQTLFGYGERELMGHPVLDIVAERNQESLKSTVRGLAGDGDAHVHRTIELYGRDKMGREFPVELSLSTWAAGGRRLYAGILRDVSDRQQAESNLRFQAGILSQVKDAVVAVDGDERVVYWSRGAERLYGLKAVDVMGSELGEISVGAPWVPPASEASVRETLSRGDVWSGEAVHGKKDGGKVSVEMTVGPLRNEEDQSVGRLMVLRDVSERKRLEGMLLHAERVGAMGQMAAGIAHELKTPLGVIYGFADVLHREFSPGDSRQMLDTMKRHVARCSNLVDNLLSFSRKGHEAEGLRAEEADVDVNEMVEAALSLVQPHTTVKSVMIRRELEAGLPLIRGVREMLEQVLVNLALNAVDAMPEKGTLTVSTRRDGGRVRIDVADTGTGILPEVQKRLFEPFFTTKGSGTGLGLWLVKQIVTNFRGEVFCESRVGKGTVFSIFFPSILA